MNRILAILQRYAASWRPKAVVEELSDWPTTVEWKAKHRAGWFEASLTKVNRVPLAGERAELSTPDGEPREEEDHDR